MKVILFITATLAIIISLSLYKLIYNAIKKNQENETKKNQELLESMHESKISNVSKQLDKMLEEASQTEKIINKISKKQ